MILVFKEVNIVLCLARFKEQNSLKCNSRALEAYNLDRECKSLYLTPLRFNQYCDSAKELSNQARA
jgi:hypothetical protein